MSILDRELDRPEAELVATWFVHTRRFAGPQGREFVEMELTLVA